PAARPSCAACSTRIDPRPQAPTTRPLTRVPSTNTADPVPRTQPYSNRAPSGRGALAPRASASASVVLGASAPPALRLVGRRAGGRGGGARGGGERPPPRGDGPRRGGGARGGRPARREASRGGRPAAHTEGGRSAGSRCRRRTGRGGVGGRPPAARRTPA